VEAWISADEVLCARVNIGEIAAASAGNSNLLSDGFIALEDGNGSPAFPGLDRAHEPRSSSADNHYVVLHTWIIYCVKNSEALYGSYA
jgi:hypothetical protein